MLSKTKYAALCVIGIEIFYVLCLLYESLLPVKGRELHRALFELLPGFVWGNVLSMIWGAVFLGTAAWITGCYIAWMHNASIIGGAK
jgi:predicted membrane protein